VTEPTTDAHPAHDDVSEEPSQEVKDLEQVLAGLKEIAGALDDHELQPIPEPGRSDWEAHRPRVEVMHKRIQSVILEPLESGLSIIDVEELRNNILDGVAGTLAEYAILVHVSGAAGDPEALMDEAIGTASRELREEIVAAKRDLDGFARLTLARWYLRRGERDLAADAAQQAVTHAQEEALKKAAQEILDLPKPLSGTPPLFTLNGFGTGLYGTRDAGPDGSVVKTLCICGLFIPLLPLSAYRVLDHGEGSYSFLHKEKLSGFAKGWLVALPLMIGLFVGGSSLAGYMGSAKVKAPKDLAAATALVDKGDHKAAMGKLNTWFSLYSFDATAEDQHKAALAYAKAITADVKEPVKAGTADAAMTKARLYRQKVPQGAQLGEGGSFMTKKLEAWAEQVGTSDSESANASLAMLDLAYELAPGGDARRVEEARARAQVMNAGRIAKDWPLDALVTYTQALHEPAAIDAAAGIFQDIPRGSLALLDVSGAVDRFLNVADNRDDLRPLATELRASRAEAQRLVNTPGRAKLFDNPSDKALSKWLKKHPQDTVAASLSASRAFSAGKPALTVAALNGVGGPKLLQGSNRILYARAETARGKLDKAEGILRHVYDTRVKPMVAAAKAYDKRLKAIQDPIINNLRLGIVPWEIENKLYSASEARQKEILTNFLKKKVESDAQLKNHLRTIEKYPDAVNGSFAWAELQLAQAQSKSGEARQAHLNFAQQTLDDIAVDAEGIPAYEELKAEVARLRG
jgi:hypothetical protein